MSDPEKLLEIAAEASYLFTSIREDLASGDFSAIEQWVQNDGDMEIISEALADYVQLLEETDDDQ